MKLLFKLSCFFVSLIDEDMFWENLSTAQHQLSSITTAQNPLGFSVRVKKHYTSKCLKTPFKLQVFRTEAQGFCVC